MNEIDNKISNNEFTEKDRICRDFQIGKFNIKKITPAVSMEIEINMDGFLLKREEMNKNTDVHLSVYSFLIKEIADTLIEYPLLFCLYYKKKIIINKTLILNIPVSIDNHVEYVFIENPETKNHIEIATELQRGIEDIKQGKNSLMNDLMFIDNLNKFKSIIFQIKKFKNPIYFSEKYYGYFPITNFGTFGIKNGTAIISEPVVAALVIGKIEQKLVEIDNKIKKSNNIMLSLSFDHRVMDGAYAGRFMNELKNKIESI